MQQNAMNRIWAPAGSLVLWSALGVFAALANAQVPNGNPPANYRGPAFGQGEAPQRYPLGGAPGAVPPSAGVLQQGPPQPGFGPPYGPPQYGPPAGTPPLQQAAAPQRDPLEDLFTPAKIIARVGDQTILAGDLVGDINQMLEPYREQASKEQLDQQRVVLMRELLGRLIETKLVYLEFLRTVPKEQLPTIEANLAKAFDEEQLAQMMKRGKVATAAELDAKLRGYGTSLDKQRKRFGEQYIAQMIVRKSVNYEPEITHREMLEYYQQNAAEYAIPAKVRWEHLMASFEKYDSEQEAYNAIAAMGNEVVGGAPLDAVAKRQSSAPDAIDGGQNDWTTQGALVWTEVDAALFQIPENRLSTIIRSNGGFHIVRVLERTPATKESFVEAQVEIKAKLKRQKIKADADKFLEDIKASTPVWTIFDDLPAELAEGQSYQELMRR